MANFNLSFENDSLVYRDARGNVVTLSSAGENTLYKLVDLADFSTMTDAQKKALSVECLELLEKGGVIDMLSTPYCIRATNFTITKSGGAITSGSISGQAIVSGVLVGVRVAYNGTTATPTVSYYTLTEQT